MRIVVGFIGLFLFAQQTWAQVNAQFTLDPAACLNQTLKPVNTSANASRYFWDFNQGDLLLTPTAQNTGSVGGNITTGIDVVFDGTNWFGFVASRDNNTLIRLDYGSNLSNVATQTVLSGVLSNVRPADIKIVYSRGAWYGFVYGVEKLLVRIDFGSTLTNTSPTTEVVINEAGSGDGGLDVVADGANFYVAYTKVSGIGIARLNTITSIPSASDRTFTTVGGGGLVLGDIRLVKSVNQWFAFAASYFGVKQVVKLDFGNNVLNTPTESVVPVSALGSLTPYGIDVVMDNGNYMMFLCTVEGSVIRTNLGSDLTSIPVSSTNLGNFGNVVSNTLKLMLPKQGSSWFLFSVSWASGAVFKLNFPDPVSAATPATSTSAEPEVIFTTPGTYQVSLTARLDAAVSEASSILTVENKNAPAVNFISAGVCAAHDVSFTPQVSETITNYAWSFGDGNNSALTSPTHVYASAGTYPVELQVTAANACKNTVRKSITLYNQPTANFTVPSANPLCTNQNFLFTNTTAAVGITPAWEWSVSGTPVSSDKDLTYAFTSTATQEVKLKASIPGCESEKAVNISTLVAGPKPDFTIAGRCEDESISFTNTSTGSINGYTWSFGDGNTSSLANPVNTYADPAVYTVTLTLSNAAGCNNSLSKPLTVFSKPQVDFTALAPPFSCSGTPTRFSDLTPPPTDSNLSTWLWNFGDTGSSSNTSSQRNPQHTYATARDYTVSLTVTSNFLCSTTFQKAVTIQQTPDAAFTNSVLCEGGVITFSDAATNNQAWNWQIGSGFYTTQTAQHVFNSPGSYPVTLSVTAANNCIGTSQRNVVIAPGPSMDFSVLRSCVNQQTEFRNLTNDASDPITSLVWSFGNFGSAQTNPATFKFLETGTIPVTLSVTTQSGCVYPLTKSVVVSSGPLAAFTAEPNSGEAPRTIRFINTSLNATAFSWKFGQGSASNVSSPTFTYVTKGDYEVELIAVDANSCSDSSRQLIEVTEPAQVNPPAPNPGTGIFTVEWKADQAAKTTLALVDATGRVIRSYEVMAEQGINKLLLDITGEHSGLYVLRIRHSDSVKTYRLILTQ